MQSLLLKRTEREGLRLMLNFPTRVINAKGPCLFSVGQAGYVVKSSSGQLLGIDLYLSNCVERLEGHKGFKRLLPQILEPDDLTFDIVICTHPHLDHFDVDAIPEMVNKGSKLFCSVDCEKLVKQLQMGYYDEQISYVKPGDNVSIGDFEIAFVHCDHGEAASDAVGVIVRVDGKTIYEVGDSCLRLDRIDEIKQTVDKIINKIKNIFLFIILVIFIFYSKYLNFRNFL